jgi:hypothetical protein
VARLRPRASGRRAAALRAAALRAAAPAPRKLRYAA